jgi:hypothetical protein
MWNPSQFLQIAKGLDFAGDVFRVGKATAVGKMITGIGRRVPTGERAAAIHAGARAVEKETGFMARMGGITGLRSAAVNASVKGADLAGKGGVLAKEAGVYGKVFGGALLSSMSQSVTARHAAVVGGSALLGLATSSPDSTAGQKIGRMVGFGIMGNYGMNRFTNPRSMNQLQTAMSGYAQGRFGAANRLLGRGLGMPAKWGMKQSMMAGALYGAVSDESSIAEGAIFGAAAQFGVKGLSGTLSKATGRSVYRAYRQKGLSAAFNKVSVVKTGMYAGAIKGAYENLGEGNWTGLNVVGGTVGGGAIGATIGATAKLAVNHPWMTLGTVGPTLSLAGAAGGAAATVAQAGAPGFDSLNADGDLALALHRMRHS